MSGYKPKPDNSSGKHPDYIRRHNTFIIWTHWIVAFSSVILIISGLGQIPFYRRHNIISIPGLSWPEQHSLFLQLHYYFSAVLIGIILFHVIYHLWKKEYTLMPRLGDFVRMLPLPRPIRNRYHPPVHFKYYSNQRLSYALTALALFLLVVSGIVKTAKNFPDTNIPFELIQVSNQLHSLGTFLLAASILFHSIALHIARQHRPLIRSMIDGMVSRNYAKKHFPRWVDSVESNEKTRDRTPDV